MATSYDLVRYPSLAVLATHPSGLAAFAALCGRRAAPVETCRVLEVGCGEGANLATMAAALPSGEFVGIDLAATAITRGADIAAAAGLGNLKLLARDITEDGLDLGRFNYIIAHGVYAWVPEGVRAALLRLIARSLTADGVAFISYNVRPGCRLREALRDILLDAGRGIDDPPALLEAAHAALRLQISGWSDDVPLQKALKAEAEDMLKRPAGLLFHDELGATYAPQLLSEVAGAAREVGLAYLCDTQPALFQEAAFPSERFDASRPVTGGDWVRFEQMLDFNDMRKFRHSLFAPGDAPVDRAFQAARLAHLHAAAELKVIEPDAGQPDSYAFRSGNGAEFATANKELGLFMRQVAEAWPASVPLSRIGEEPDLIRAVMRLFLNKIVSLTSAPVEPLPSPGPKPLATPLARAQAAFDETHLSSRLHRSVRMEDASMRGFVQLLDGTRTTDDLARAMAGTAGMSVAAAAARTQAALDEVARMGLLTA